MSPWLIRTLSRAARPAVGLALSLLAAAAAAQMSSTAPASAAASGATTTVAPTPTPAASGASIQGDFNVTLLFANTCGWCHAGAGRVAGRGPKLMDTTLTDAELTYRIKAGKTGAMPAFGSAFTEDQMKAIVKYIRDLKPDGAAQ
jgi:mono/diheme cytochrome c family protein